MITFPLAMINAAIFFRGDLQTKFKISVGYETKYRMAPCSPDAKNPTLQQRIDWHLEHAKNCGCRKIPGKLAEEMKKRNIRIPVYGSA